MQRSEYGSLPSAVFYKVDVTAWSQPLVCSTRRSPSPWSPRWVEVGSGCSEAQKELRVLMCSCPPMSATSLPQRASWVTVGAGLTLWGTSWGDLFTPQKASGFKLGWFCLPGTNGDIFGCPSKGVGYFRHLWQGMLRTTPQCTGQPLATKNYPAPNVNSAKREKSCPRPRASRGRCGIYSSFHLQGWQASRA